MLAVFGSWGLHMSSWEGLPGLKYLAAEDLSELKIYAYMQT